MAGALAEQALIEAGRKAGFVDIAILGDRLPLRRDRLRRYPLFSVEFLDWLFTQIPEDGVPIYTAHPNGQAGPVSPSDARVSPGAAVRVRAVPVTRPKSSLEETADVLSPDPAR